MATVRAVELSPRTAEVYISLAFRQMLQVADRLGDERVNDRPLGPQTNAVAALIIHCCAVSEFWLGHVALGRPSNRDRDSEFTSTATVAELHQLVERSMRQTVDDVQRLDAGEGIDEGGRQYLEAGDTSDAAVVLHVLEELYQHLGHMELAADALL
jgi:uncharacterized damage-inducible protein DinB